MEAAAAAAAVAPSAAAITAAPTVQMWVDVTYEFCAPHYFDFTRAESAAQIYNAELWFEYAAGYDPSPYNPDESMYDMEFDKIPESPQKDAQLKLLVRLDNYTSTDNSSENAEASIGQLCSSMSEVTLSTPAPFPFPIDTNPAPPLVGAFPVKRQHSEAKPERKADRVRRTNAMQKSVRPLKRPAETSALKGKAPVGRPLEVEVEARPFKRRKLDLGGVENKQVVKATPSLTVPRGFQLSTDKRAAQRNFGSVSKMPDLAPSFTSLAEQIQKFHMKTPERFRKKPPPSAFKPRLGLTKPKTPDFETSHRIRPPRVKSAAELEEEMLAKLPKFKARPANKKILKAPTLPALTRSTPQQPHFQPFNLKTMERALQHTAQKAQPPPALSAAQRKQRRRSAPGGSRFHIPIRVRPTRPVKTTEELQLEEISKQPKFKARPLNKKIFESRGEVGIFRTQKRQVTAPIEFNFATNERLQHHHTSDVDHENYRRFSLDSHPRKVPEAGLTIPEPFHLQTEDRGAFKVARFMEEQSKQMFSESMSRIPKANLLPLTTDVPSVPPKPAQKECTKPEPFQLESLLRHEHEVQRQAEERARAELEELQARKFRAQPIPRSEGVFLPERSRKPLTEIKEFEFHVDSRATQRAEFEKKVLDKKNQYLQYKDELEALRKEEEDKFIKALRKDMVPQARPMPLFDKIFIPQRSSKALTLPVSPLLNSSARNRRQQSGPFAPQRKFRMKC